MKHQVLLTFHTEKPISDLTDKIQQRIYMLDGIDKKAEMACQELTSTKPGVFNVEFVEDDDAS